MVTLPPAPIDVTEIIDQLFVRVDAPYGPLDRSDDGVTLIPGTLYRYRVRHPRCDRAVMTVYRGLDRIGGELWDREVRGLLSLSLRTHAHLPRVIDGQHIDKDVDQPLAYVISEAGQQSLSDADMLDGVTWHPDLGARSRGYAFQQLLGLMHGLSWLHRRGIVHRCLGPDAIELNEHDEEERPYSLRLTRFEMSTLVGNLFRMGGLGGIPPKVALTLWGAASSPAARTCIPPERWPFLEGRQDHVEDTARGDVYALGALAWLWLVRITPGEVEACLDEVEANALGELYDEDVAALAKPIEDEEGARALNRYMVRRCGDRRVPPELRIVLKEMLAWEPNLRPRLDAALASLREGYGSVHAWLDPRPTARRLLVGYMPNESKITIFQWGWIQTDPTVDDTQLRDFIAEDLRGAELVFCREGFIPYGAATEKRDAYAKARWVLLGKQAAWFCDVYERPRSRIRPGEATKVPELLLIKYLTQRSRAWHLEDLPLRRRLPPLKLFRVQDARSVDAEHVRKEARDPEHPDQHNTWEPMLQSVKFEREVPPWAVIFERALDFLLEFHAAQLRARMFPFRRMSAALQRVHVLQHDPDLERGSLSKNPVLDLYCRTWTREMGTLYRGLDNGERSAVLDVYGNGRAGPDYDAGPLGRVRVTLGERGRADVVEVEWLGDVVPMPEVGWVKPADDRASERLLQRQRDATRELVASDLLLNQLHAPFTIKGLPYRWAEVAQDLDESGQDATREMLRCRPFFALHGPPGAGKTTVASRAIRAWMEAEPTGRLLVTSQNHHGLDNLAIDILKEAKSASLRPVVVRVLSDQAIADDKPMPQMIRYGVKEQASEIARTARERAEQMVAVGELPDGSPMTPALRRIAADWSDGAARCELELRERIRRAATLVFATTGTCAPDIVGGATPEDAYDWVLVEEAARAWPTELAMPLVRGHRWTLIGDHLQLPAFDRQKVTRLLAECEDSEVEDLKLHGADREAYEKVYDLFATLFGDAEQRYQEQYQGRNDSEAARALLAEPLRRLHTQHRMRKEIADLVGRAFYRIDELPEARREEGHRKALKADSDASWLGSGARVRRDAGIREPAWLRERSLVWVDTSGLAGCEDSPFWFNRGEAGVIGRILERLSPVPKARQGDFLDEPVALLTPYQSQVAELKQVAPRFSENVHTVNSYQGRQADIVFVSLVRSVIRGSTPEASLGFMVDPAMVNVMISRARRLLVLVGNYEHFRSIAEANVRLRSDLRCWERITRFIGEEERIVDAASIIGGGAR